METIVLFVLVAACPAAMIWLMHATGGRGPNKPSALGAQKEALLRERARLSEEVAILYARSALGRRPNDGPAGRGGDGGNRGPWSPVPSNR